MIGRGGAILIRSFFNNRFKLKNIYEAKDKKLIFALIQCIIVGSLIAFPLVFQIIKTDSQRISERVFPSFNETNYWKKEIPNCSFNKDLKCEISSPKEINVKNQYLVFDPNNQYKTIGKGNTTIILGKNHVEVNLYGFKVIGGYSPILEASLNDKKYDNLLIGIVSSVKMQAVAMVMQIMYPITIITNLFFIAIVAVMALLFNIGNSNKLRYKQFFSFLSYAATIPAIVAFIIGTFFSIAFVYIAFNFGFVIFSYYIYKKYNRDMI